MIKEWIDLALVYATETVEELTRKMSRFSTRAFTLANADKDVSKLKNTPISGDTIAVMKKG